MAHLRILQNREGRTYYYVAQTYRENGKNKQRTLLKIGRHDLMLADGITDPATAAREVVNQYNARRLNDIILTKTVNANSPIEEGLSNLGYQIPESIYTAFGISDVVKQHAKTHRFDHDLDQILKTLVLGRILDPGSKRHTFEQFQLTLAGTKSFKPSIIPKHILYRSLDHLRALGQDVQLQMHKSLTRLTGRSGYLVFYDVTNYYFESDLGDPDTLINGSQTFLNKTQQKKQGISFSQVQNAGLRKHGASKEYRKDPIVQLGLFMDTNGIPISYKLFPGNQADPVTYRPALEQIKQQFGLERVITVADKAMNSKDNIEAVLKTGDGWVFSQKVRGTTGIPADVQDFVLSPEGWVYDEDMSWAQKSMLRERKLDNKKCGKTVREKVLVVWRKTYAEREQIRREGALSYASALTNPEIFRQTMRKGGKKYLKLEYQDKHTHQLLPVSPNISIDQGQVDYDAQFDGMNVIVTSEIDMEDEEIIATYGQLGKIEDCFRVSKFNLKTRPVFVWTSEHVEAHFLICFIALTILRYLQHRLGYTHSPERIIKALRSLVGAYYSNGYWEIYGNEDIQAMLKALGCELNAKYQPSEHVLNLGRRIDVTKTR